MPRRTLLACLLLLPLAGCGPSRTQAEVDRGREAVTAALEAWKKKEPAVTLNGEEVTFSEDWRKTHTLVEYALADHKVPDERTIAYAVTLKLKDKRGKEETRETVYRVALGPPLIVSRDPYD